MKYDYLVVGAGLFGAVFAHEAAQKGKRVLVVEKRRQVTNAPRNLENLEYRSLRFENELLDQENYQGNAVINYTDRDTPWTRIIEHKWFTFGKNEHGDPLTKTIISRKYPVEWHLGDEPYYPVNDKKQSAP